MEFEYHNNFLYIHLPLNEPKSWFDTCCNIWSVILFDDNKFRFISDSQNCIAYKMVIIKNLILIESTISWYNKFLPISSESFLLLGFNITVKGF